MIFSGKFYRPININLSSTPTERRSEMCFSPDLYHAFYFIIASLYDS